MIPYYTIMVIIPYDYHNYQDPGVLANRYIEEDIEELLKKVGIRWGH
jgi:hypothetical protein